MPRAQRHRAAPGFPGRSVPWAVLLLLTAGAAPASGQTWTATLLVGTSANRLAFEDPTANDLALPTPGFQLGVVAGRRLSGALEVETGMLFTTKGFDSDDEKLQLAYLEIPVLVGFRWPTALSPRVFAGAVAGFEVGCTSSRVPGVGELDCDAPLASLQRRTTDLGIMVGVGGGVGAGPGEITLDVRINQGLRDISAEPRPDGWVRNQSLLVTLGYRLTRGGAA